MTRQKQKNTNAQTEKDKRKMPEKMAIERVNEFKTWKLFVGWDERRRQIDKCIALIKRWTAAKRDGT